MLARGFLLFLYRCGQVLLLLVVAVVLDDADRDADDDEQCGRCKEVREQLAKL
jgi:hypothetical protein